MRRFLLILLAVSFLFASCSLDALERGMRNMGDWTGGDADAPSPSKVTNAVENAGCADVRPAEDGKGIVLTTGSGVDINIPLDTQVSSMLPPASDELMNNLREQIYADGSNKAFSDAMGNPLPAGSDTVEGAKGSATIVGAAIDTVVNKATGIEEQYQSLLTNVQAISDELKKISEGEAPVTQGEAVTIMLTTDIVMDVLDCAEIENGDINGFDTDSLTDEKLDSLLASAQLLQDFTAKTGGNSDLAGSVNKLMSSVTDLLKDNI